MTFQDTNISEGAGRDSSDGADQGKHQDEVSSEKIERDTVADRTPVATDRSEQSPDEIQNTEEIKESHKHLTYVNIDISPANYSVERFKETEELALANECESAIELDANIADHFEEKVGPIVYPNHLIVTGNIEAVADEQSSLIGTNDDGLDNNDNHLDWNTNKKSTKDTDVHAIFEAVITTPEDFRRATEKIFSDLESSETEDVVGCSDIGCSDSGKVSASDRKIESDDADFDDRKTIEEPVDRSEVNLLSAVKTLGESQELVSRTSSFDVDLNEEFSRNVLESSNKSLEEELKEALTHETSYSNYNEMQTIVDEVPTENTGNNEGCGHEIQERYKGEPTSIRDILSNLENEIGENYKATTNATIRKTRNKINENDTIGALTNTGVDSESELRKTRKLSDGLHKNEVVEYGLESQTVKDTLAMPETTLTDGSISPSLMSASCRYRWEKTVFTQAQHVVFVTINNKEISPIKLEWSDSSRCYYSHEVKVPIGVFVGNLVIDGTFYPVEDICVKHYTFEVDLYLKEEIPGDNTDGSGVVKSEEVAAPQQGQELRDSKSYYNSNDTPLRTNNVYRYSSSKGRMEDTADFSDQGQQSDNEGSIHLSSKYEDLVRSQMNHTKSDQDDAQRIIGNSFLDGRGTPVGEDSVKQYQDGDDTSVKSLGNGHGIQTENSPQGELFKNSLLDDYLEKHSLNSMDSYSFAKDNRTSPDVIDDVLGTGQSRRPNYSTESPVHSKHSSAHSSARQTPTENRELGRPGSAVDSYHSGRPGSAQDSIYSEKQGSVHDSIYSGGRPGSAVDSIHSVGRPGSAVDSIHSGGRPGSAVDSIHSGGQPGSAVDSIHSGGRPGSAVDSIHSVGRPGSAVDSIHSGGRPGSAVDFIHDGRPESINSIHSSGRPGSAMDSIHSGNSVSRYVLNDLINDALGRDRSGAYSREGSRPTSVTGRPDSVASAASNSSSKQITNNHLNDDIASLEGKPMDISKVGSGSRTPTEQIGDVLNPADRHSPIRQEFLTGSAHSSTRNSIQGSPQGSGCNSANSPQRQTPQRELISAALRPVEEKLYCTAQLPRQFSRSGSDYSSNKSDQGSRPQSITSEQELSQYYDGAFDTRLPVEAADFAVQNGQRPSSASSLPAIGSTQRHSPDRQRLTPDNRVRVPAVGPISKSPLLPSRTPPRTPVSNASSRTVTPVNTESDSDIKVRELEQKLTDIRGERSTLLQEVDRLREELKRKEEPSLNSYNPNSPTALQRKIDELNSQIQDLQEANESAVSELQSTETKLKDLNMKHENLLISQSGRVRDIEEENIRLQAEVRRLKENQVLHSEATDYRLKIELQQVKEDNRNLRERNYQLHDDNIRMKEELSDLRKSLEMMDTLKRPYSDRKTGRVTEIIEKKEEKRQEWSYPSERKYEYDNDRRVDPLDGKVGHIESSYRTKRQLYNTAPVYEKSWTDTEEKYAKTDRLDNYRSGPDGQSEDKYRSTLAYQQHLDRNDLGSRSLERGDIGSRSLERGDIGARSLERGDYGSRSMERGDYGSRSMDRGDLDRGRRQRSRTSSTENRTAHLSVYSSDLGKTMPSLSKNDLETAGSTSETVLKTSKTELDTSKTQVNSSDKEMNVPGYEPQPPSVPAYQDDGNTSDTPTDVLCSVQPIDKLTSTSWSRGRQRRSSVDSDTSNLSFDMEDQVTASVLRKRSKSADGRELLRNMSRGGSSLGAGKGEVTLSRTISPAPTSGLRSHTPHVMATQHNKSALSHSSSLNSLTQGLRPFAPRSAGDLQGNDVIKFSRQGGKLSQGTIKFIGHLPGRGDIYLGVELDKEDGKHDGVFEGIRYFKCKPSKGVFVAYNKVVMAWTSLC